ncbi:urease accessory protein UreD [Lichenifustis flavocetrariae]|uniref:Urease accessory protein UreD n=1 Tax=Lichenifustis flavocetrariae TaxID=2949735 RepID=A0AA41YRZ8_9HYPH|nr:urease accessory protein UreD [Lichenifustis flavocetrariae]MCW6507446.1 urease accessory protein UreD [Lichenifustis flavocetrariae]
MTAKLQEVRAQLDLAFVRHGERTILGRRLFRWPYVLTRTFALDQAPAHLLTVILQTSSSALHGGDWLHQRFHIGSGAAAHCTTQGASPIHRAAPELTTHEAVAIEVKPEGYFEYLPEARILFPDAALDQIIDIDCAPGGVALVADTFTIHDPMALDRSFRRLCSTLTLRCGGEPMLVDRMDIRSLGRGRTAANKAFGTMLLARPGQDDANVRMADELSKLLAEIPDLYAAASVLPAGAGLGVRLAGRELRHVRKGTLAAWTYIRRELYGAAPAARRMQEEDAGL